MAITLLSVKQAYSAGSSFGRPHAPLPPANTRILQDQAQRAAAGGSAVLEKQRQQSIESSPTNPPNSSYAISTPYGNGSVTHPNAPQQPQQPQSQGTQMAEGQQQQDSQTPMGGPPAAEQASAFQAPGQYTPATPSAPQSGAQGSLVSDPGRMQRIQQAKMDGTFTSIRDKYNVDAATANKRMDMQGNIVDAPDVSSYGLAAPNMTPNYQEPTTNRFQKELISGAAAGRSNVLETQRLQAMQAEASPGIKADPGFNPGLGAISNGPRLLSAR